MLLYATAGIIGGSLHAWTGPDHLAALLPLIFGRRWFMSSFWGVCWGLGHSCSAAIICALCFVCKDSLFTSTIKTSLGNIGDILVGLSLIVIGCVGIHETLEEFQQLEKDEEESDLALSNLHIQMSCNPNLCDCKNLQSNKYLVQVLMVFINGLTLGFSWDGLPSLSPAISAPILSDLACFVIAYGIGTMGAMAVSCCVIGEVTAWFHQRGHKSLPLKLSFASSCLAGLIGLFWFGQACLRYLTVDAVGLDTSVNDALHLLMSKISSWFSTNSSHVIESAVLRDDLERKVSDPIIWYSMMLLIVPIIAVVSVVAITVMDVNGRYRYRLDSISYRVVRYWNGVHSSLFWWDKQKIVPKSAAHVV